MADERQKTSFNQFEYCPLCRSSHKNGKKHVYSKHHQMVLNNILKKFALKIHEFKKNLFNPDSNSIDFERSAKFWCYFCVSEFDKHAIVEDSTVVGSGLLHHIASDDHKLNMEKFFWDNLVPKKLKPKYVLSKEDLYISQRASLLAVKKFQKANRIERQKITDSMVQTEMKRRTILQADHSQSECLPSSSRLSDLPGNRVKDVPDAGVDSDTVLRGYKSLGLTRIQRKDEDDKDGNVHTGATPPWLNSGTDNLSKEIGPNIEDFRKHLENERKAKLPSCRVGAKFDRNSTDSPDWLPSFGSVWSKGRRQQTKHHFEKEWRGKQLLYPKKSQGLKNGNGNHSTSFTTTEQSSSYGRTFGNSHFGDKQTNQVQPKPDLYTPCYKQMGSVESTGLPYQKQTLYGPAMSNTNRARGPDTNGVAIVPYKRHKKQSAQDDTSDHLLQTPVLSHR